MFDGEQTPVIFSSGVNRRAELGSNALARQSVGQTRQKTTREARMDRPHPTRRSALQLSTAAGAAILLPFTRWSI